MFTGIIRELGQVRKIGRSESVYDLDIKAGRIHEDIKIGDSVAVNGVCLTVTAKSGNTLSFNIMPETARRTTLSTLKAADRVNLEGSLKAGGSIDGHFVLGHVDCVGAIKSVDRSGGGFSIRIGYPEEFDDLVVDRGSVAVEGISLTVSRSGKGILEVHIIPHTSEHTTLEAKRAGDAVNLEFDVLGKYAAKKRDAAARPRITEEFLRSKGF